MAKIIMDTVISLFINAFFFGSILLLIKEYKPELLEINKVGSIIIHTVSLVLICLIISGVVFSAV